MQVSVLIREVIFCSGQRLIQKLTTVQSPENKYQWSVKLTWDFCVEGLGGGGIVENAED